MVRRICLLFVVCSILLSQSVFATVTGRVIDAAGKPVFDAMVMYTNLANRLVYTYTCTDGTFSIPSPDTTAHEWSIKTPHIYNNNCGTGIINAGKVAKNDPGPSLDLSAEGGMVRFFVSGTQTINVALYSLNGRKIMTVFNDKQAQGRYRFNPFSSVKPHFAHQMYIVRVGNGSVFQSKPMLYTGKHVTGKMAPSDDIDQSSGVPKRMASLDTIRAGKTGYTAAKKAVTSYASAIGDITITVRDIEAEITALMNGKTTEWKANQVTQGIFYNTSNNWGTIFYGVGNGGPTTTADADSSDGWQTRTIAAQGVPKMIGVDAVHGFISPPGGQFFPHNIGMGATQIPELMELEERVTAIELRAMGINWAFAPCIDVPRSERYGRTYEGWDEGPDGTAICAKAAIRGFQGTDLSASGYVVAACAKHFAGAGGGIDGTNAGNCATATGPNAQSILCSIHLPGFKAAVDNGMATCMGAMNQWMGTYMHQYKVLLTDTLKTAWKWDGFISGDWMASNSNGVTLINSFNAGVDNMMNPTNPNDAYNAVLGAPIARLDDACKRILRVKLRLDLMNDSKSKRDQLPLIAGSLHKQVARECVRRSMVLLKNDALNGTKPLPINVNSNVHIIGDFADNMWMQIGGWALDWPSAFFHNPPTPPPAGTTLRAAITAACKGTVTYSANATGIPASANVIVVCVGEQPYAESGGDAPASQPYTLTQAHKDLITQAAASGKPVVVVMYSGRPLIITDDIAKCQAWLQAWLPGTEGGGIADILFSINGEKPTGKLTHTWPATYAQIPINTGNVSGQQYGDFVGSGGTPLFAYHFGLTY